MLKFRLGHLNNGRPVMNLHADVSIVNGVGLSCPVLSMSQPPSGIHTPAVSQKGPVVANGSEPGRCAAFQYLPETLHFFPIESLERGCSETDAKFSLYFGHIY